MSLMLDRLMGDCGGLALFALTRLFGGGFGFPDFAGFPFHRRVADIFPGAGALGSAAGGCSRLAGLSHRLALRSSSPDRGRLIGADGLYMFFRAGRSGRFFRFHKNMFSGRFGCWLFPGLGGFDLSCVLIF